MRQAETQECRPSKSPVKKKYRGGGSIDCVELAGKGIAAEHNT